MKLGSIAPSLLLGVSVAASGAQAATLGRYNPFGEKLYKEVAQSKSGNLVISPLSVALALGMAYGGAEGETAEELRSVVGFSADVPHASLEIRSLLGELR